MNFAKKHKIIQDNPFTDVEPIKKTKSKQAQALNLYEIKRFLDILVKKEFLRLQETFDEVQIIGCKGSCNSVWCPECYKRKGGSKGVLWDAHKIITFEIKIPVI